MLQQMFDELVQFVANDVPFFKEERDQRIERLRELVSRVDATPSEKFRRLLEAYQIEMEYGRTMSAYRQTLADGREADMVRLGRVTLLYRTVEGGETEHSQHKAPPVRQAGAGGKHTGDGFHEHGHQHGSEQQQQEIEQLPGDEQEDDDQGGDEQPPHVFGAV